MSDNRSERRSSSQGQNSGNQQQSQGSSGLSREQVAGILAGDGKTIADAAEALAERLSELSKSRMRSFYGRVVSIFQQVTNDTVTQAYHKLHLLRPRLAYLAKREPAAGALEAGFKQLLDVLKSPTTASDIQPIMDFSEALVAYHRKFGKGN